MCVCICSIECFFIFMKEDNEHSVTQSRINHLIQNSIILTKRVHNEFEELSVHATNSPLLLIFIQVFQMTKKVPSFTNL